MLASLLLTSLASKSCPGILLLWVSYWKPSCGLKLLWNLLNWVIFNYILQSDEVELPMWPSVSRKYRTAWSNKLCRDSTHRSCMSWLCFWFLRSHRNPRFFRLHGKTSCHFEFYLEPFCIGCLYIALVASLRLCTESMLILINCFGLECQQNF